MPTLNINGKRVTVDESFLSLTPEQQNATVDEIAASFGQQGEVQDNPERFQGQMAEMSKALTDMGPVDKQQSDLNVRANLEATKLGTPSAFGNAGYRVLNGLTMGLADELNAGLNTLPRMIKDRVGLSEAYAREDALIDEQARRGQEANPISSTVAEIGGGLVGGAGLMKNGATLVGRLGANAGLGTRVAAGAAEGAAYSGAYGAGNTEGGIADRAEGALNSAGAGAVIGGGLPVLGAIYRGVSKPLVDAVSARRNPQLFADKKIVERITQSGKSMDQIGNKMSGGLSIADAGGKSTNSLLRTATNIPGAAKDKVNAQLTLRQFGQGDRLKSAVSKTFADPDAYLSVKDDIAAAARKAAKPLYDEAYATPVPFTRSLEDILKTSAGKKAIMNAKELASNEQAPFKSWFANVADDGTVEIMRVPDMRAWDYIKRSLDDMIDAQIDPITKKISNSGRILTNLKNKMVDELDNHVDVYAAARKASSDGFKIDEALELGRKSRLMEPEALKRAVSGMSAPEKEALRVGAAEGLRKRIDDAGMTANSVLRIFSNRREIANLKTLFDNDKQFAEFRKTIFAEARKRSTYDAVKGNSTTAAQLADMVDAGGLSDLVGTATTAATSGPGTATMQFIGSRLRMLGGLTPEVADAISQRLMTTNPQAAKQIIAQLQQIERSQVSQELKKQAVTRLVYPLIGMGAAATANQ